ALSLVLLAFPTRRSSDLTREQRGRGCGRRGRQRPASPAQLFRISRVSSSFSQVGAAQAGKAAPLPAGNRVGSRKNRQETIFSKRSEEHTSELQSRVDIVC